jgi:Co/Zn/Cd efflux system component
VSDHGSSARAILYAFTANLGIALAKLWAAFFTASGSMLAESIHSFADCGNQILLWVGCAASVRLRKTFLLLEFPRRHPAVQHGWPVFDLRGLA